MITCTFIHHKFRNRIKASVEKAHIQTTLTSLQTLCKKSAKADKSINDASWSKFTSMLIYKADWFGKDVVKVNRFYASSKTCECGVKNTNLKLSDREWTCQSCGLVNQRDLLAANNILKEGCRSLGDITDAETEVTKSVKRLKLNVIN